MSAFPAWVNNEEQIELFGEAEALGASTITLSNELSAKKFVQTKRQTGKPQYYRSYLFHMTLLFPLSLLMLDYNHFSIFFL